MPCLCIISKELAPYRVDFYNEVARSLKPEGWRVALVVAKFGANDHPWANAQGVNNSIEIIEASPSRFQLAVSRRIPYSPVLPNGKLINTIHSLDPDIVWTHEYSLFCITAAIWALIKYRHCVLSSELGDQPPHYACTPLQLSFHKALSFLYEGVVANTPEATRRTHPQGAPVFFAPHAINTDDYYPAKRTTPRNFRFIFVGGISNRKGIPQLIEACDILSAMGHQFELRVVGTGYLSEWLAGLHKQWLSIVGFLEGESLANEYRQADAYVLPTEGDTYGVTVHEAAASGLPLIVGRSAGAVETLVIEGVTGYAIDPKDVCGIAEKMAFLLANPEVARAMGVAARAEAERYDVKILGKKAARFVSGFLAPEALSRDISATTDAFRSHIVAHFPRGLPNVTAVFVTMNRASTALTCLEMLYNQSRRPDRVIVIDNDSNDETATLLSAFQMRFPDFLEIVTLEENLGNAGGIKTGMDKAFEEGADAVWILDDDSWPMPDALETLLDGDLPPGTVRASRVIDPATGHLSWAMQVYEEESWKLLEENNSLPSDKPFRIRRSWLGSLIPRVVYEKVGPVNGELFLRGEDEDYPRRIEDAGFPVYLFPSSILHHPPSGRLHRWSVFGQEIVLESGLKGDKLYYRLRNAWWIEKERAGCLKAGFDATLYFFALTWWKRGFKGWFAEWVEAFHDATSDRLGKRGG